MPELPPISTSPARSPARSPTRESARSPEAGGQPGVQSGVQSTDSSLFASYYPAAAAEYPDLETAADAMVAEAEALAQSRAEEMLKVWREPLSPHL